MDRITWGRMALLAFVVTAILIVGEGMGHWLRVGAQTSVPNNPSRLVVHPRIGL